MNANQAATVVRLEREAREVDDGAWAEPIPVEPQGSYVVVLHQFDGRPTKRWKMDESGEPTLVQDDSDFTVPEPGDYVDADADPPVAAVPAGPADEDPVAMMVEVALASGSRARFLDLVRQAVVRAGHEDGLAGGPTHVLLPLSAPETVWAEAAISVAADDPPEENAGRHLEAVRKRLSPLVPEETPEG